MSDLRGPTPTKYYKDTPEAAARRNGYRRLREKIAGSRRRYYALNPEARAAINRTAIDMYDLGVDYTTAAKAETVDKRGFVYIITNRAWPGYCKIGRAFNPDSRLAQYQTSSPLRDYELKYAVYFDDCHAAELTVHSLLAWCRADGEWYRITPYEAENTLNFLGGYI